MDRQRGRGGRGCLRILVTLAVLAVLLVGAIAAVWLFVTRMQPAKGVLTRLAGNVETRKESEGTWSPATADQEVGANERVRTGAGSAVSIVFFELSTVGLGSETEVSIGETAAASGDTPAQISLTNWRGSTSLRLIRGSGPAAEFVVESPTALTAMSGGETEVVVAADGTTQVTVTVGSAEVTSKGPINATAPGSVASKGGNGLLKPVFQAGQVVVLNAGETATITPDGVITVTVIREPSADALTNAVIEAFNAPGTIFEMVVTDQMINDYLSTQQNAVEEYGITNSSVFFTGGFVAMSGELQPGSLGIPFGGEFTATATPSVNESGQMSLELHSASAGGVAIPAGIMNQGLAAFESTLQGFLSEVAVGLTLTDIQVNEGSMTLYGTKPAP